MNQLRSLEIDGLLRKRRRNEFLEFFSARTASTVATLTLSRSAAESASTVERYPEPRMIVHNPREFQANAFQARQRPQHRSRHIQRDVREADLAQRFYSTDLIDVNKSGSSCRTAAQNLPSAGSNILALQIVIARKPPGRTRRHSPRAAPCRSGTKKMPKTHITTSKERSANGRSSRSAHRNSMFVNPRFAARLVPLSKRFCARSTATTDRFAQRVLPPAMQNRPSQPLPPPVYELGCHTRQAGHF